MIEISDLAFSYGRSEVLKNISLSLLPGKIYGLLGENGVGKTTLLSLLSGLKKPGSGSISIDGDEPYRRHPSLLSRISYLYDYMAPENERADRWAASKGRFWPDYSQELFLEIMEFFETDPSKKMTTMSSGQFKKACISFVLACQSDFIFLDEPTNGLDIPSKSQFRMAILKYTKEDSTVVISTHQVRDLEDVIDPIVILDRCDTLLNASLEEISEKLYFDYGLTVNPGSIYSEQLPGGLIQVYPNEGYGFSKVNIEALFNAVYKNKEMVKELFRK